MQLRNSRVLVTGASRGLGRNIAQAMARRGADVALVARNAEQLEELAKELGGKAYPADLMDPAAVEELIGGIGATLEKQFRTADAEAKERHEGLMLLHKAVGDASREIDAERERAHGHDRENDNDFGL